ncbi:MAG: hypothetical protein CFE22_14720 [Cytophagaceae bacterium BCCC1]|nr:MAG: hypothetical protein CFE22_14720 [Cytophagaceae bacterium BCCC1]
MDKIYALVENWQIAKHHSSLYNNFLRKTILYFQKYTFIYFLYFTKYIFLIFCIFNNTLLNTFCIFENTIL